MNIVLTILVVAAAGYAVYRIVAKKRRERAAGMKAGGAPKDTTQPPTPTL